MVGVCSTMRQDFATLGYKAESNGVPRREGFLHRALQRGCVASMLVGVEQYSLRRQYAVCQAAKAVRGVSGCRVRTRSIEAALRDLIAQGSCYIAQPHGQRRTAITAKRMTSSYIQNTTSK